MSKVFFVNVGANTAHQSKARSPLRSNGSFDFVTFPEKPDKGGKPYPKLLLPFVSDETLLTHLDPDWNGLTYGDWCHNPRAYSLRKAEENDIFLFWSLFWEMEREKDIWSVSNEKRRWCLIGALRLREILHPGDKPENAKSSRVDRAKQNMHFHNRSCLEEDHYVFIGCTKHSNNFSKAIDLGIHQENGLLYRTILSAHGEALKLNGKPRWNSSLRGCRVVWDLSIPDDCRRANIVRMEIKQQTNFDFLEGLLP